MGSLDFFILCAILCIVSSQGDAARILAAFPLPSVSHQVAFRSLTHELARRGHHVTVITTDPAFERGHRPPNLTEIDVHDLSYEIWDRLIKKEVRGLDTVAQKEAILMGILEMYELQLKTTEVQRLLNEPKRFDLVLLEACVRSPLIYTHLFKAPVISISSTGGGMLFYHEIMGIPTHPLLYPSLFAQRIYNLSMWEKVVEIYRTLRLKRFYDGILLNKEDEMFRRVLGPDTPSLFELGNNVDMWFVNSHPMWMGNIPVPPSVIHIGGFNQRAKRAVPEDMQSYLNSSKHGVIYMSFGTNTYPSMLPAEKIQAFVKVFSELPYDVLWKWDLDELPGRTENIRIGKWFPQADLLRHPKIKLFITQGGFQSTEEAIDAGVPLIGVPMLADQWYNVERYEHFKIGKRLDIGTLTVASLRDAIRIMLSDNSFRENVAKLRSLMRDEPQPALARAVWWTEHVLRHGGAKHLRAPAANLTWGQYYEMPLAATLLTISAAIFVLAYFAIRWTVKSIWVSTSKVKQN